jgi:hypothetical protein
MPLSFSGELRTHRNDQSNTEGRRNDQFESAHAQLQRGRIP